MFFQTHQKSIINTNQIAAIRARPDGACLRLTNGDHVDLNARDTKRLFAAIGADAADAGDAERIRE